jgi:hypothetical protein
VASELVAGLVEALGAIFAYLAPWLARWISPDSAGAVDDLNLYIYVGNNPLKYRNLTGHVKIYSNRHLPYNEIDILYTCVSIYSCKFKCYLFGCRFLISIISTHVLYLVI